MPTFEPAQLAHWLRTCETEHSACREDAAQNNAPVQSLRFDEVATCNFRVIDVEHGCVVQASLDSRYVVLSYTGMADTLRLTSANYTNLTTDGVLADPDDRRAFLPTTVCDALDLVAAMGERYLWVDTLCLMHDDDDDLDVGVSLQHAVFGGAVFMIVAAVGDASLPLYDGATSAGDVDNVDADQALSASMHATQAWTLADVALSQRAVLFTQKGVFFCCGQGTCVWSDDRLVPVSGKSPISRIPGPVDSILPCLASYLQLSQEFLQRILRHDGDALRAFHSIGRPLWAGMRTVSVEGLPAYYVNTFLLFRAMSPRTRRRTEFASYAWTGWAGGVEWLLSGRGEATPETAVDIVHWLQNDSLVEWDELEPTGQVHRLRRWRLPGCDGTPAPPSNLAVFLQEHAQLFGETVTGLSTNEIDDTVISPEDDLIYSSGSHARLDMVDWVKDVLSKDEQPTAPARFPKWAFDLVASRGQLDRLQRKLGPGNVNEKTARSWATSRWARVQKLKAKRGGGTSKPVPDSDAPPYRRPRLPDDDEEEQERQFADQRAKNARKAIKTSGAVIDIPIFPPYSVLIGWAVHLSLILGAPAKGLERGSPRTELPLLSTSGTVFGTLYPDDASRLPQSGSKVDLLILGRDMQSSAKDSLWVLCISWHNGVAERRGMGRVRNAALEGAVEGPDIKRVLLG